MPTQIITFNKEISSNVEKGNILYYSISNQGVLAAPVYAGEVTAVNATSLDVDVDSGTTVPLDAFILFSKNTNINESSLKGYYADLTLENTSNTKAELFAVNSNITPSSK